MPVDASGAPIPLLTYPAIAFLKRRVEPATSVFEYGSGSSTLWWAGRVKHVESVEHDAGWYQRIRAAAPENVKLHLVPLVPAGDYAAVILEYESAFDLVIIDGRERVQCAKNSLRALRPDGAIVWDDTDRGRYGEGVEFLRSHGFRQVLFGGMHPTSARPKETSIFYRPSNRLGL